MKIKTFTYHLIFLFAFMLVSNATNAQDVLPAIYSPGFEEVDYDASWEDWENSSINDAPDFVHGGALSLMVSPAGGGVGQLIEDFTPGTDISLLAWAISDGVLNGEAYIGFYFDEEEVKSSVSAVNPNGWSNLCVTATIPDGTGELYVYFWYDGDTTELINTYVDDFEVKWGNECQYLGIDDPPTLDASVNVYPNPSTGLVQISIGEEIMETSKLEIFDYAGRLVYGQNDLKGQKNISLDLTPLASGMYFGMINSEVGTLTFKIIKE